MKILIIGMGYVGTTTGLVFCEMGHKVTGLDVDEKKIASLNAGNLYFYEPGLDQLLEKHIHNKNITFTNKTAESIRDNDVIFICVGTPQGLDGGADLRFVQSAAELIGKYMNEYKLIVDKSTVPVGTADLVKQWISENQVSPVPFDVVSNPEFLKEGTALQDALQPDRIVIGCSSEKANHIMKELYKDFNCPIVETEPKAAELIKYAANSFLALKISYANEMAKFCDAFNIDVNVIATGIGLDKRIGPQYLRAGIGYGGSCFPKDVNELLYTARKHEIRLSILEAAVHTNEQQAIYFIDKLIAALGSLKNKKIALLGLSFKPDTDDIRESPALKVINQLINYEAIVKVHDPIVVLEHQKGIYQYSTVEDTVNDADAVLICTDWDDYKKVNWRKVKELIKSPYIFDGRNMLNPTELKEIGFVYQGIGVS